MSTGSAMSASDVHQTNGDVAVNADDQLSLTARTVRGAGWVVGWRVATRLLGTIGTLFLVRLLAPGDVGLVALACAVSNGLDGLSEIGVGNALIREHRIDRALYDTGFTLNAIRGVTSAVLIVCCAWPVARFFAEPRLAGVLLALAAGLSISAAENIGIVDFQRNLAFEREFGLYLAPRILGIAACLSVAYVYRSYWALVVGILTTRSLRLLCSYLMHPYRPRLSLRAWRQIVGFSFWSWMLAWVSMIRDRIDNFTIGRMLGTTQVGLYSIACDVGLLGANELVAPITRALFPGLVQVRIHGKDVADAYFRAISATLVLVMPGGAGVALVASPLIQLVAGPRWGAAVPLIQIFAVVGAFRVVTYISTTLMTVYGMLQVQFASTAGILLVRFTLLLVLIGRFGLVGAGYAVAIVAILEEAFYLVVTFRRFHLRPAKLFAGNWRSAIATAAMVAVVVPMQTMFEWGPAATIGHLAVQVLGGAVTYMVVLFFAWVLSGRPWGPEAQIIAVARDAARLVQRRGLAAR